MEALLNTPNTARSPFLDQSSNQPLLSAWTTKYVCWMFCRFLAWVLQKVGRRWKALFFFPAYRYLWQGCRIGWWILAWHSEWHRTTPRFWQIVSATALSIYWRAYSCVFGLPKWCIPCTSIQVWQPFHLQLMPATSVSIWVQGYRWHQQFSWLPDHYDCWGRYARAGLLPVFIACWPDRHCNSWLSETWSNDYWQPPWSTKWFHNHGCWDRGSHFSCDCRVFP